MSNRLKYSRCYLAGAIEFTPDHGIQWRQRIKSELSNLDIFFLDPTCKPINIAVEDLEHCEKRQQSKRAGDFDWVSASMRTIRCVDLRMVDISDFLIVNLDINLHTCGTYEEIFWANRQKKPILVRCAEGKARAPDWLLGTIPHQLIFTRWSELTHYLRRVATAPTVNDLGRWMFFDWEALQCGNQNTSRTAA